MTGAFSAASVSQLFMGALLPVLSADLGWPLSGFTGAITLGTLTGGMLSPLMGRLADRHGPRYLATGGALVLAGALVALAYVEHLWQFYLAYVIGRAISQTTLSGDVARTTAVNWFRRMRGRALGLTQMALPLGGSALALLAQVLLSRGMDWREVFTVFGIGAAALILPLALVLRRRPEDIGLEPDGDPPRDAPAPGGSPAPSGPPASEQGWTLRQATRTPAFWLLTASITVGVSANGAVGFHMVNYFEVQGIPRSTAIAVLSVYAVSGALANGLWGFLVERVPERPLAAGTMVAAAVMTAFLLTITSTPAAVAFAILFGLAARGETSLVMIIVAQYYGRRHFGAISGFMIPFQMTGLGMGPLLASLAFDLSGAYVSAFGTVSAVYGITAVLLWLARRPRPIGVSPQRLS